MANALEIPCPECEKPMKFPAEVAGKKVRCKACGHVFRVEAPAGERVKAAAKPVKARPDPKNAIKAKPPAKGGKAAAAKPGARPAPKKGGDDDADANPYGVADDYTGKRCPFCAQPMEEEAVICLECGYNTSTRERHEMRKVADRTFWDWFLWLFPAILGVIITLTLVGFDVWYIMWNPPEAKRDEDWGVAILASAPFKLWIPIGSGFVMFGCIVFAFKRLVLEPVPPEREKALTLQALLSILATLVIGFLLMGGAIAIPITLILLGFFPGCLIWFLVISMWSAGHGMMAGALAQNKVGKPK